MIPWLKQRRRRRILEQPFPRDWLRHVQRNMWVYDLLSQPEQARLHDDLRVFIDEKYWEGCGDLQLTEEMKVTIAAHACLLTLNLAHHDYFKRVQTILVYPNAFVAPHKRTGPGGIVSVGGVNSGEAWFRGPIIISWADALAGGRGQNHGRNLILHEFAHALDMMDGLINGTPLLNGRREYARWNEVMTAEFQQLQGASDRAEATLLDQYGATNVGEFFAVATECFFEQGLLMRQVYPKLYESLREYYRQDPAGRQQAANHGGR